MIFFVNTSRTKCQNSSSLLLLPIVVHPSVDSLGQVQARFFVGPDQDPIISRRQKSPLAIKELMFLVFDMIRLTLCMLGNN